MVQWIDELKQTNADNIQGLIPSNSVPAKILKGGVTGLSNFGYDTANFVADIPKNSFLNPMFIPNQVQQGVRTINQAPAMIRQGVNDFKANPIEKTAEAAGYIAGGLALGGVGAKVAPKITPKIAPKVTPKATSSIPTVPKNNSGVNIKVNPKPVTAQGLAEKHSNITRQTSSKNINNQANKNSSVNEYIKLLDKSNNAINSSSQWISDPNYVPAYKKGYLYAHGSPNAIPIDTPLLGEVMTGTTTDIGMVGAGNYVAMPNKLSSGIPLQYSSPSGGVYMVESVNPELFMQADKTIFNNPANVQSAYRNFYKTQGYTDDLINQIMKEDTGADFRNKLVSEYGEVAANQLLNANGIPAIELPYVNGGRQANILRDANTNVLQRMTDAEYIQLLDEVGY